MAEVFSFLIEALLGSDDVIEGFFLPDWAAGVQAFVDAAGGYAFEHLEYLRQCVGPAFVVSHWCEQKMDVIWHYDGGVKFVAFAVVVEAVLEYDVSGFWRESGSIALAECYEYSTSCFLKVREFAPVVVFSFEAAGHDEPKIKDNNKVKGVGQECPTHTSIAFGFGYVCDK